MMRAESVAPGRRPGRARVVVALAAALCLAGCGGGGGQGGGGNATPGTPAPTTPTPPIDKASALDYQYQAVVGAHKAVTDILVADKAAVQALVDGRNADWDRYWTDEYPVLLGQLQVATETLQQSENHIHKFVYGLGPVYTKDPATEKFVIPLPIVLGAIAVITYIAAKEKSGYAAHQQAADAAEFQALVVKLEQVYVNTGLSPPQAKVRAEIEAGKIKVLRALQTAIDSAKTFVIENFTIPAFSSYLPDKVSEAVDLKDLLKQAGEIKNNVVAIFTTQECRQDIKKKAHDGNGFAMHPERSALAMPVAKSLAEKDTSGCRIYFCSTSDGRCPKLPAGNWEAAVFAPGHLRGTDDDVVSSPGAPVAIQAPLVAAADIGVPAPVAQCSKVQNAGGDQADTRNVPLGATSGSFTLTYEMWTIKDRIRVLHDGAPLFDSGCVSDGKTQLIPFSGLASFVTIQVEPNCTGTTSGTAWNYTVACPAAN